MLFELHDDPTHAELRKIRANLASSWSGPKCNIIEVDIAGVEPGGLMCNVCVVPTVDYHGINCAGA
eukprot:7887950-Alexandrium_andersonii.AAC.1